MFVRRGCRRGTSLHKRALRGLATSLCAASVAHALNNGLARTPPMGYNSWFLDQSGSDASLRAAADAMVAKGFLAAGYNTLTIDDLWANERDNATGDWVPRPDLFPHGTQSVLEYWRGLGFRVGQYTDRGTTFCGGPDGTGSQGYELHDGLWFGRNASVDFVKEDSCSATADEEQAFHQYALMRDALNASGRPIVFSLCGWEP
jgi:alpha-galactosidase